jgi:RimJ/RimL family protein N-acetyltransferase/GNAT superfamily N-acetyltransferase
MPTLPLPDPPLQDQGIRVRAWREEDLPDAHRGTLDPLVPRFTAVPADNTLAHVRAYFEGHARARASGDALHLAIADAGSDGFLGSISLLRFAWSDARCEIGYWVAPWGRGRGAATIATRLLSHWALTELGLHRIELHAAPENAASQRVAERAGFRREGRLRDREPAKDGWRDLWIFGLLADDLRERPAGAAGVVVRPARPGDGRALARIYGDTADFYAELAPHLYRRPALDGLGEEIEAALTAGPEPATLHLVAEHDGAVVAALEARLLEPDDHGDRQLDPDSARRRLHVEYLATSREHRRAGAGTRLVEAAEAWGRERGATVAETSTYHASPVSLPFWQRRMGYEPRLVGLRKPL